MARPDRTAPRGSPGKGGTARHTRTPGDRWPRPPARPRACKSKGPGKVVASLSCRTRPGGRPARRRQRQQQSAGVSAARPCAGAPRRVAQLARTSRSAQRPTSGLRLGVYTAPPRAPARVRRAGASGPSGAASAKPGAAGGGGGPAGRAAARAPGRGSSCLKPWGVRGGSIELQGRGNSVQTMGVGGEKGGGEGAGWGAPRREAKWGRRGGLAAPRLRAGAAAMRGARPRGGRGVGVGGGEGGPVGPARSLARPPAGGARRRAAHSRAVSRGSNTEAK
jgi:hypothetical protein